VFDSHIPCRSPAMPRICLSESDLSRPWQGRGMGTVWYVWISIGRPQTACWRPASVRLIPATTRSSRKMLSEAYESQMQVASVKQSNVCHGRGEAYFGARTWVLEQWARELRPAWHTTNLGYDQNFCFDLRPNLELRPAPAWRAHIRYHVQFTASFTASTRGVCLFCRRDHADSSYQSLYSINKYRVTEKGCVSLTERSSINQALRPAWRS
jgi:hypothetical protein